ncbi:MAG: hypothetical protein ACOYXT_12625 [Bacteroidota bacterium]
MSEIVTILAFSVVIPLAIGLVLFRKIPAAYRSIVFLCGLWLAAEIYSYVLRVNDVMNAHVSYILTAFEIFFFASFYAFACSNHKAVRWIGRLSFSGFAIVTLDAIIFNTPLNTFSLSFEYLLLTGFAVYLFYEIVSAKASKEYSFINFVLLFYLLSSFPYFFAWEWLRISNMELLLVFAGLHSFVHAACYLLMAVILWRSSLSYSHR